MKAISRSVFAHRFAQTIQCLVWGKRLEHGNRPTKNISTPRILSLRPFGTDAGFDLQRMVVMFGNSFHDRAVVAIPAAPLCVDSGGAFQSNVLDLTSHRQRAADIGVDDEAILVGSLFLPIRSSTRDGSFLIQPAAQHSRFRP